MVRRLTLMAVAMATVVGLTAEGLVTVGGATASEAPRAGVVVEDISIPVPGQDPVQAYLVRPAGQLKKNSAPGVLWLHWLGEINNDRSEYLPEAITLAGEGVVSVLPLGYFPWVPNPGGTTGDVTLVENQVAAFAGALDRLAGVRAVDESRIAMVGHDYGAMYGSILAANSMSTRCISTMVLEAPDALMGNWFAQFWLQLEGPERDAYLALFDGLDPVDHTAASATGCCSSGRGRTSSSARTSATRTPRPAPTRRSSSTSVPTTSSRTTPRRPPRVPASPAGIEASGQQLVLPGEALGGELTQPLDAGQQGVDAGRGRWRG